MKKNHQFYNALMVGTMILTLSACSTKDTFESASSIMVEKAPVSSIVSSSLPQQTSSLQSNVEISSKETPSSSSAPMQSSSSSKKATSSTPTSKSSNTSSQGGLTIGTTTDNAPRHPTSGLPLKQRADPDTGISWDGVSPIIYTYPDGSTGTEKRDGAMYESTPGMFTSVIILKDDAGRVEGSICPDCNKKVGQKYHPNSCEQFASSQYCMHCGAFVEPNKCHTCSAIDDMVFYCDDCGKKKGDGTKGTCARWLMCDVDCPNCGEHVAVRTCHTCK